MSEAANRLSELEKENEQLKRIIRLTSKECMSGGFCMGMAARDDLEMDELDIEMLKTAGRCISRIINKQEAEP